jgi:hypothetical protein
MVASLKRLCREHGIKGAPILKKAASAKVLEVDRVGGEGVSG